MRFLRRRKEDRCRSEFKRGYRHGRLEVPWIGGQGISPERDPYYRGWNLGQRVTRRLAVIEYERGQQ